MAQALIRYWTGPLPRQEMFPADRKINPLLHWVYHPLKRWSAKIYVYVLQKYFGLKVIAVTGSAGKTTTKEMLVSILSLAGPVTASRGNITSTYNIPDTILRCRPRTRYLILEMGVEYPGDMDFYTWLATPHIGLITTVNRTHTAYLGSLEQVSAEKGRLLAILPAAGFAVVNTDDPNITVNTTAQVKKFGHSPDNDCQILSARLTPEYKTQIELSLNNSKLKISLPLLGTHFASDAAASALIASLLDIKPQFIIHGLETVPNSPHRMQIIHHTANQIFIDDCYNANPLAVAASLTALSELAKLTGKTPVAVLGQMNELGQYEESAHREIGGIVKQLGIKHLYVTGPAAKFIVDSAGTGQYFDTQAGLLDHLKNFFSSQTSLIILFKASRSLHFETLIQSLTDNR